MTIRVTTDEFNEQFQEADEGQLQWDASDKLDITYKLMPAFLRDGVEKFSWEKAFYYQLTAIGLLTAWS